MGLYKRIEYLLDPPITIIRYVPALAWVPLFILWFGISELTKVLLIILGVMSCLPIPALSISYLYFLMLINYITF